MYLSYSKFAAGVIFTMPVSNAVAAPIHIYWSADSFSTAVEGFAKGYVEHIKKNYGTVPSIVGEGKMVGLVNVQADRQGTRVYIGGKKIIG